MLIVLTWLQEIQSQQSQLDSAIQGDIANQQQWLDGMVQGAMGTMVNTGKASGAPPCLGTCIGAFHTALIWHFHVLWLDGAWHSSIDTMVDMVTLLSVLVAMDSYLGRTQALLSVKFGLGMGARCHIGLQTPAWAFALVARFRGTWATGNGPRLSACILHLQAHLERNASSIGHVGKPAICWL